MAKNTELIRVLRAIPPKWALGIIAILIGYWLLQPLANRTFGWTLPSLVQIVNNDYSVSKKKELTKPKVKSDENQSTRARAPDSVSVTPKPSKSKPTPVDSVSPKVNVPKTPSAAPATSSRVQSAELNNKGTEQGPTYGYLKSIGRDRYESPEGLVYAPGSEEGHRLKHVERHTKDIPDRPGSHGVFEGDMPTFLVTIDKGYRLAMAKGNGTQTREEDGLSVLEVTFDKKIGFVGGSDGRRKGTPSTKRLRIVLNGDRVITAFPY